MMAAARNEAGAQRNVADALRSVTSLAELHEILWRLAQTAGNRWTRSQVLHDLDRRFADAAEPFFDGERIRPPRELPPRPTPMDVRELDEVLADIAALSASASAREKDTNAWDVPGAEGTVGQP